MRKIFYTSDLQEHALINTDAVVTAFFRGEHSTGNSNLALVKHAMAQTGAFSKRQLADLVPPDGYFGVHSVALASEEMYGPNRNDDAFGRDVLQNRHPTFVKYGCVYREHDFRPYAEKLGMIAASAFNPKLERVELVSWIKNGSVDSRGRVLDERARNSELIEFSMSAAMPWDTCSACGHRAKNKDSWCSDMRNFKGQFLKSAGVYVYARNNYPKLKFFDNSVVDFPAERTARAMRYIFREADGTALVKAASVGEIQALKSASSTELAETMQLTIPDAFDDTRDAVGEFLSLPAISLLNKLASVEKDAKEGRIPGNMVSLSNVFWDGEELSDACVKSAAEHRLEDVFAGLADRGVLLSFPSFCAITSQMPVSEVVSSDVVKCAACCLGSLFGDIQSKLAELMVPNLVGHSIVDASVCEPDPIENMMDETTRKFSQRWTFAKPRMAATLSVKRASAAKTVDAASFDEATQKAAGDLRATYGLYKIATLQRMLSRMPNRELDDATVLYLAVAQNSKNAEAFQP